MSGSLIVYNDFHESNNISIKIWDNNTSKFIYDGSTYNDNISFDLITYKSNYGFQCYTYISTVFI